MPRGGKREGAGHKPRVAGTPSITRSIRLTPAEWEIVCKAALALKLSPSDYIRERIL